MNQFAARLIRSSPLMLAACTAAFLWTCIPLAEARLGDTRTVIEERYGPPTQQNDKVEDIPSICRCWYEKNDIIIIVTYINSVSYQEGYEKKGNADAKLTDDEITVVLNNNRVGRTWINNLDAHESTGGFPVRSNYFDNRLGIQAWKLYHLSLNEKPYAEASWSKGQEHRQFIITATAYDDYVEHMKKVKAQSNLGGF